MLMLLVHVFVFGQNTVMLYVSFVVFHVIKVEIFHLLCALLVKVPLLLYSCLLGRFIISLYWTRRHLLCGHWHCIVINVRSHSRVYIQRYLLFLCRIHFELSLNLCLLCLLLSRLLHGYVYILC